MPEYDFHTLSPSDFEQLARDLLHADLGLDFEVFGRGPDGGVDLRYTRNKRLTIAQCKHYRGSTFSDLKKAVIAERSKLKLLEPDHYTLVTSKDLSLSQKETLKTELHPYIFDTADILAAKDLNKLLSRFPGVEKQHFKLWMASTEVLEAIVNSGVWARSAALMEEIQDRVKLYVSTPTFTRAQKTLNDKRVCVITGAPGVGKSMLSDMLALARWESGWQIISIDSHSLDSCWDVWRPEVKQLFVFDDIFGQTDLRERLATNSGSTIARLLNRVSGSKDKGVVITTRTHVLAEAIRNDEFVSRANLLARECVVQVSDYDKETRARILYNHLYFSDLARDRITEMIVNRGHLKVIEHKNFTPRIIDLTIKQLQDDTARTVETALCSSLDAPVELWGPSFEQSISAVARSLILQLVSHPVHGGDVARLKESTLREREPSEYSRALRQLEGSWIEILSNGTNSLVSFKDPSCRDFAVAYLNLEPDYFIDVITNATDTYEIVTALQYSLAKTNDGGHKYENIQSTCQEHKKLLEQLIKERWLGGSSPHARTMELTLARIVELSEEFDLDLDEWVARKTADSSVVAAITAPTYSSQMRMLSQNVRRLNITFSDDELANLVQFGLKWLSGVDEMDGWDEVDRFFGWIQQQSYDPWTSRENVEEYGHQFGQWITNELDAVSDNASTLDEAQQWVDEIKAIADSRFASDTYGDEIRDFEIKMSNKFDDAVDSYDYENENRSASAISRPSELAAKADEEPEIAVSESSDDRIAGMFDQLQELPS